MARDRIRRRLWQISLIAWIVAILVGSSFIDDTPRGGGLLVWALLVVMPAAALLLVRGDHNGSPCAVALRGVFAATLLLAVISLIPLFVYARGDDVGAGLLVAVMYLVLLGPGIGVYLKPMSARAIIWLLWASPLAIITVLVGAPHTHRWEESLLYVSFGAILVLIVLVQPLVLATKRADDTPLPPARLR